MLQSRNCMTHGGRERERVKARILASSGVGVGRGAKRESKTLISPVVLTSVLDPFVLSLSVLAISVGTDLLLPSSVPIFSVLPPHSFTSSFLAAFGFHLQLLLFFFLTSCSHIFTFSSLFLLIHRCLTRSSFPLSCHSIFLFSFLLVADLYIFCNRTLTIPSCSRSQR